MTLLAERPTRQVMTGPPHPDLHLVSELRLAALPTAVVCAQLFTKYTLQEWRLYELIEMAERLTTELVTNAVRTTGITDPNPRWIELHDLRLLLVRMHLVEQSLIIEVADSEPTLEVESGRALFAVQSMSQRWNYYQPRSGGKVVWCELALPMSRNALDQTQEIARPLPRRVPKPHPEPPEPIEVMDDPNMLRRVWDGLRYLDDDSSGGSAMR